MYYRTVVSGYPADVTAYRKHIQAKQLECKYAYGCVNDDEIQKRSEEFPFSEEFNILYENRWPIRRVWRPILHRETVEEGIELVVAGDAWDIGMLAKQASDRELNLGVMTEVDRAMYCCTTNDRWGRSENAMRGVEASFSQVIDMFPGISAQYDAMRSPEGYHHGILRIAGPLRNIINARDALRRGAVFKSGIQDGESISFFSPDVPIAEMGLPATAEQRAQPRMGGGAGIILS